MPLLDPIFNYCERTLAGAGGEPLNAVSNIAFFIAAWALWREYKKSPPPMGEALILILLVFLIGIGSTLFHVFATRLTMIGDIVPIALFTFYYLWVAMRRLLGLRRLAAVAALIGFAAVASQMSRIPAAYSFNGSVAYFPCLAALLAIGVTLRRREHPSAFYLLRACAWFAVSLTFRSLDYALCPILPVGTHFLWHAVNGLMLYLLVAALLTTRQIF